MTSVFCLDKLEGINSKIFIIDPGGSKKSIMKRRRAGILTILKDITENGL
jgi:hypothetical protein